jgi:hypothetical protein
MKATIVLIVLLAAAMGALAAQPVTPASVSGAASSIHATEPAWMMLSGATLLAVASMVRRLLP